MDSKRVVSKTTHQIIDTNLGDHVAVHYWCLLQPRNREPTAIEILKEKPQKPKRQEAKSAVYRLCGVGVDGAAVVAKRCRRETATIERIIYTEILPSLPLQTLRFYGFMDEPEHDYCWLFLEDAGGQEYCPQISAHRTAAGRFLALLHMAASTSAYNAQLPLRDGQYYLAQLLAGKKAIQWRLDQRTLCDNDSRTLHIILEHYQNLESQWQKIERLCSSHLPFTLVHGDFVVKNMRVRSSNAGLSILPFDWEVAGWGLPTADLGSSAAVNLSTYLTTAQEQWPDLSLETVQQLAALGKIFRTITAINWAAESLAFDWIQGAMYKLEAYVFRLGAEMSMAKMSDA